MRVCWQTLVSLMILIHVLSLQQANQCVFTETCFCQCSIAYPVHFYDSPLLYFCFPRHLLFVVLLQHLHIQSVVPEVTLPQRYWSQYLKLFLHISTFFWGCLMASCSGHEQHGDPNLLSNLVPWFEPSLQLLQATTGLFGGNFVLEAKGFFAVFPWYFYFLLNTYIKFKKKKYRYTKQVSLTMTGNLVNDIIVNAA